MAIIEDAFQMARTGGGRERGRGDRRGGGEGRGDNFSKWFRIRHGSNHAPPPQVYPGHLLRSPETKSLFPNEVILKECSLKSCS